MYNLRYCRAECESVPEGKGYLLRRWFVDPLTSFDAGAIALSVAERRNRQPKKFFGARAPSTPVATRSEKAVNSQEDVDQGGKVEMLAEELGEEALAKHINETWGKQLMS